MTDEHDKSEQEIELDAETDQEIEDQELDHADEEIVAEAASDDEVDIAAGDADEESEDIELAADAEDHDAELDFDDEDDALAEDDEEFQLEADEGESEEELDASETDDEDEFQLEAQVAGSEDSEESAELSEDGDEDPLITPKLRALQKMRLEAKIEAIIFASPKPLKTVEIHELLDDESIAVEDVQACIDILMQFYEDRCGGFVLHYVKRMGYQYQTVQSAGAIMERMFASRPRPISRAALETLAIIAYRQPVTRAEVEFIRGVDAGSIFKTLMERDLVKCVGRKEIVGRPMLFGTTDEFLKVFNLGSIRDLPPLESFQPSQEAMQGAIERIEGDDAVDVEKYIGDAMASQETPLASDEDATDDDVVDVEALADEVVSAAEADDDDEIVRAGAEAAPEVADEQIEADEDVAEEHMELDADEPGDSDQPETEHSLEQEESEQAAVLLGEEESTEEHERADSDPEVDLTAGPGIPEGSRDLDS